MPRIEDSAEIKRLKANISVELLWIYILKLLKEKPMHAYAIRKEISEKFGFLPGNVTAYVVLYKLETRDFVKSEKQGNRTMYSITANGKKLFEQGRKEWEKTGKMMFG